MNIRDIARLANVTPSTVSKVLNNYPDIGEATRKHVLQVIEDHGYDPRANAHSARRGSISIGLVIESVYNRLYSSVEDVLSINLHNAGYSLITFHDNFFSQDKREKFAELCAQAERSKLKGLIYIGGNFACLSPEELNALSCPAVFFNTVLPDCPEASNYSSVRVNHFETAVQQMRCLMDKGHTCIAAVISSLLDISVYGQRAEGYRLGLRQAGLEVRPELFLECDYSQEKAYEKFLACLRTHPEITAVCVEADIMVPGVLRAIHDAGRIAGKDVDVISFDGLEMMPYCIPSVSTFAQPMLEMAEYAEKLLIGVMNKTREHQHITFRPKYMKRESC